MALIAAKSYYFGVGGSVADFCALVQVTGRCVVREISLSIHLSIYLPTYLGGPSLRVRVGAHL